MRDAPGVGIVVVVCALALTTQPCQAEDAPAAAEGVQAAPAAPETIPVPSSEDVSRMIQELASVRDYERFRWILNSAEQQVPPVRAALLKKLDDHVQELFRAEVELRTASALSSVQALTGLPGGTPAMASPSPPSIASGERPSVTLEPRSDVPSWVKPQTYEVVEQQVRQWQPADQPLDRLKQLRELNQAILGVEGRERRQELQQLLKERNEEAAKSRMSKPPFAGEPLQEFGTDGGDTEEVAPEE